jgi:hypothetical protein
MFSDPDQVVVTTAGHSIIGVPAAAVHHREFPEVSGEGGSPRDAAARLFELLVGSLDCVPSDWRRETLERAIEDVRAFTSRAGTSVAR